MKCLKVPSEVMLGEIEDIIIEGIQEESKAIGENITVIKIEWTAEGLDVWIQNEK